MTGRTLLIALTAAALYAAVLVASASADEHQVRVTLTDGQVLVLTVDVAPGQPLESAIPALPAPVASVEDLGPVETPTPTPEPTPEPTSTVTPPIPLSTPSAPATADPAPTAPAT